MVEGKNILIRQLELEDENYLYKWWNSGEVMTHAGFSCGLMKSKESIILKILKDIESSDIYVKSKRFIICKKENLKPIGELCYSDWDSRNQKCEIGIKICDIDEQGKGYGEDVLYNFLKYLFRHLNLNKIELTTMHDNNRAQNLYKKLGFKEIGIIREGYFDGRVGKFVDVIYMDLLKKDFEKIILK